MYNGLYNANLQVNYVKSNVESKKLIGKCSILNAKTFKYNPLNLNVNLNIAYEKVNVQGKKLECHTRTVEWRKCNLRRQTTNVG